MVSGGGVTGCLVSGMSVTFHVHLLPTLLFFVCLDSVWGEQWHLMSVRLLQGGYFTRNQLIIQTSDLNVIQYQLMLQCTYCDLHSSTPINYWCHVGVAWLI